MTAEFSLIRGPLQPGGYAYYNNLDTSKLIFANQKLNMTSTETNTIEDLIADFYRCFQFEPGGEPNYDSLRKIFHPQARITPPVSDTAGTLRSLSLDRFVAHCRDNFKDILSYGGKEYQLKADTEISDNVAQVFSHYEFTVGYAGPVRRGINCFQLVRDANRWWIMTLMWDREKK